MVRNSIYGLSVDAAMSENVAYDGVHHHGKEDAGNTYEEVDLPVGHEEGMVDTQQRNGATSPIEAENPLYEAQQNRQQNSTTIDGYSHLEYK